MKKRVAVLVTVLSFVLLPVVSEAGGFDFFKKKAPEKTEKKVVKPKKVKKAKVKPEKVKPAPRAKKSGKPLLAGKEILIGFEENYMAERDLKHSRFPQGNIQFESVAHLGTLSYEALDGLTLNGKIGTAQLKNEGWGYGKHDYELAWGAGGEVEILKCLNKYFPKIPVTLPYNIDMKVTGEYFAIGSDKETGSGGTSLEEDWEEWNAAIIFSKDYGAFTPYIGVRISWAEAEAKLDYNTAGVENFNGALKADDHIGGIIGVDAAFSKCGKLANIPFVRDLSAGIEVRAFDEFALTGNLNYTLKF